jgi:hypothetical protein
MPPWYPPGPGKTRDGEKEERLAGRGDHRCEGERLGRHGPAIWPLGAASLGVVLLAAGPVLWTSVAALLHWRRIYLRP